MVVDASIWVGGLVPADAHHGASRRWLGQQSAQGGGLVVPTLALVEVAGAVARRTGSPELGHRAAAAILQAPGVRMISLSATEAEAAADLASRLFLRGADAVYVSVAVTLGLPLVTWDTELQNRAGSVVRVLHP